MANSIHNYFFHLSGAVKIWVVIAFFLCYPWSSFSETKDNFYIDKPTAVKLVQKFIEAVKSEDEEQLAELINYPLGRQHPLKSVKDQADFIKRYPIIFDDQLKEKILEINPEQDIWWNWRGIALLDGGIWLEFNGKIKSLNYHSKQEHGLRKQAIEKEKTQLHPTVRNFTFPILKAKTETHIIRVDQEEEESYKGFQYSSWSRNKTTMDKPDLVLKNGELIFDGSGGNHHYVFKNREYTYTIWIVMIGMIDDRDTLEVKKDGKILLYQDLQY